MKTARPPLTQTELAELRRVHEAGNRDAWRQGDHAPHAIFIEVDGKPRHIVTAPPSSVGMPADIAAICSAHNNYDRLLDGCERAERLEKSHAITRRLIAWAREQTGVHIHVGSVIYRLLSEWDALEEAGR